MTVMSPPMCEVCTRRVGNDPPACSAFPDGIPAEIYVGDVDHRRPYLGDHDIQFESDGSDYAKSILSTYDRYTGSDE